jgi:hypothetical protein
MLLTKDASVDFQKYLKMFLTPQVWEGWGSYYNYLKIPDLWHGGGPTVSWGKCRLLLLVITESETLDQKFCMMNEVVKGPCAHLHCSNWWKLSGYFDIGSTTFITRSLKVTLYSIQPSACARRH